ncbi:MAG: hypothetical protein HQ591_05870 [candidate division Zixibacteria bacterium]|nr:hypothetical protein [Candidatus Tariuqbacter arcticus]
MINIDYPDNCLKGIPNRDFLFGDGTIATHLFYFESEDAREDGWKEQSINWEDDESAIDFTLNQKKDGDLQFKAGIAILPRKAIDRINRSPMVNGVLSYERKRTENNHNPYHGNILLKNDVIKSKMKQIAASLALGVDRRQSKVDREQIT